MQIGYQQLHLAPPSEKSSIRQRCLGSRLPGGMESIKADKQVTVGTPGTRSAFEIKGLLDPMVRERRLSF